MNPQKSFASISQTGHGFTTGGFMKCNQRITRMIRNIFGGLICFLLLTALLLLFQMGLYVFNFEENASRELNLVTSNLEAALEQEESMDSIHALSKRYAQQAALLLEDEPLNDGTLIKIRNELKLDSLFIHREDGSIVSSCGRGNVTPEFLYDLKLQRTVLNDDEIYYTSLPLKEDRYLAVGLNQSFIDERLIDENNKLTASNIAPFMSNELIIGDLETDTLLLAPSELQNVSLSSLLAHQEELLSNIFFLNYNDNYKAKLTTSVSYENYLLFSVTELNFFSVSRLRTTIIPSLIGFGFLILLLITYVEFIRTDMRTGKIKNIRYVQLNKKLYLNTILFQKFCAFALIGVTCITCILFAFQLLVHIDDQSRQAAHRLEAAASVMEEEEIALINLYDQRDDIMYHNMVEISSMIAFKPSLVDPDMLSAIARLYNIQHIGVFDENGQIINATPGLNDFTISTNPEDDTYSFWDIINGFARGYMMATDPTEDTEEESAVYFGVPTQSGRGMVLAIMEDNPYSPEVIAQEITKSLKAIQTTEHSSLLTFDQFSGICVFDSSNEYTNQHIDNLDIKPEYLRSGYSGTHKITNQEYLLTALSYEDLVLLYITPTHQLMLNSWFFTLPAIIVSLLVILITLLPHFLVETPGEDIPSLTLENPAKSKYKQVKAVLSENGEWQFTESQKDRLSIVVRWERMHADEKLRFLLSILVTLSAGYMLLALLTERARGDNMIVNHILEQNWDRRLSLYAISYVLIVLCGIWFVTFILEKITDFVVKSLGSKWRTNGVLISNIIRYGALIISIFFALHNFGVETSTLITSASILTMVFGFGAQSLMADIIAGIFLIFEGTFHMGDIVTIDGWRGEVVEIGLRTTKIKNDMGNVKIFQNSRIHGAVNMTTEKSYASCDFSLPYGMHLNEFEKKLVSEFLPSAQKSIPNIHNEIKYDGVVSITGYYTTLRISVECYEEERDTLQMEMFRALKLWMEENKLETPSTGYGRYSNYSNREM